MTKRELKQVLDDKLWWQKLEVIPGWRLMGWTDRRSATFMTANVVRQKGTVELQGYQAEQLMEALHI